MSWEVKYRMGVVDVGGITWTLDIEEDGYSGSITEMRGSGKPFTYGVDNGTDDFNSPILSSWITFEILVNTNFEFADLYSVEDMQFRVRLYQDDTSDGSVYFVGYIKPREYTEPYEITPYFISVTAICGLEFLQDIIYEDDDGSDANEYYNGRTLESQIIFDILAKIGFEQFTEYINIYEENMASDVGDSPMDQLKIDVDLFKDFYCYDVLVQLLIKYNARIIQKDGNFVIYRPKELIGSTVYGRIFTDAETKTATSFTPTQYINRTSTHISTLRQTPGGVMMIQSPARKVTINQDYGNKESWIDNWDFKAETCVNNKFDYWTTEGDISALQRGLPFYIPAERDGVLLVGYNVAPDVSRFISQSFAANAIGSITDGLLFEFDYLFYNYGAVAKTNVSLFIEITSPSPYYLHIKNDLNELEWTVAANYIEIVMPSIDPGISVWTTFKGFCTGIPEVGEYIIKVLPLEYIETGGHILLAVKNIKFYVSSTALVNKPLQVIMLQPKKGWLGFLSRSLMKQVAVWRTQKVREFKTITVNEYTKSVSPAINGPELNMDFILGDVENIDIDNISEQFAGAITLYTTRTLAGSAEMFVLNNYAKYLTGGVVLSSSGADIIFTAQTAGVNFTGNTEITNVSGDLSGTVDPTQANQVSVARQDRVELTGTSGTAYIVCETIGNDATWNGTLAQTAIDFVTDFYSTYEAAGIILSYSGAYIYFTAAVAGVDFEYTTSISPGDSDLDGVVITTQNNQTAQKRIDTITLTGSTGTANILCDAVNKLANMNPYVMASSAWNTRGGSEDQPILEIICDELSNQLSRPKQLIQLPIKDTGDEISALNVLGSFQDDLNQIASANRKFVFNRGTFNIRMRTWEIDLLEIIE